MITLVWSEENNGVKEAFLSDYVLYVIHSCFSELFILMSILPSIWLSLK